MNGTYSNSTKFVIHGHKSICDDDHTGHLNEVTPSEIIKNILHMVIAERRVRAIFETVGVSSERMQNILTTNLEMAGTITYN